MKNSSRFFKFIGGKDLFYGLGLLLLIGLTILIYNQVSFIFHPLLVIISTVAPPMILAFIAYYLLNPIVDLLERLRIKRIWGIVIIIIVLGGLLTTVILLSAPAIERQVNDLIVDFPKYLQETSEGIESRIQDSFLGPYYEEGYQWVTSTLSDLPGMIKEYFGEAYKGVLNVASTVTHVFVAIFTFPIILFFLLKDNAKFKNAAINLLPPRFRPGVNTILDKMDVQVGSYIRGQILVALCIGALLFIGYLIIGLDFAITLAIIAGVTSVVPYLGPTIAVAPAIIIAIVDSPFMLVKLAIVWAAVQLLEGNLISPNIMGRTMQIHPLTIILVMLISGNLFGFVGIILAIPGYAIIKVIVTHFFDLFKMRYNHYYGDKGGLYDSSKHPK